MSGELDETADARPAAAQRTEVAAKGLLKAGSELGKYRLDRVLGEGGMGVVWAAHDPDLERAVAIKVLRYAQAATQLRQRLLREARAMAKLKHPNVLTVYEVGTVEDRDYIAMELVDGATLDTWFGHATYDERWAAVLAAGRGLAAAHAAGVVHRDFKPHNVLRSRNGRVLVTDFGLARGLLGEGDGAAVADHALPAVAATVMPGFDETLEATPSQKALANDSGLTPNRKNDSVLDSPLTQTGALIGTPAYMAPEQYLGAPPDPRTDQFAFCVTAWQALTGERPFKGVTLDDMRKSVGGGVAHIPAKMPRAVRAVLARGLDPDAAKRWPSLEDLLDALERAGQLPVRRRRIAFAVFGIVMAILVVLVNARREGRIKSAEEWACESPEKVFAEAWSPAVRSELGRIPGVRADAFQRVAAAFDQFRDKWVASYLAACRTPIGKPRSARLACFDSVRDEVSALNLLLRSAPPQVFEQLDPPGILPNLKSCDGAAPIASPPVPTDQPRRGKSLALLARAMSLRAIPTDQLDGAIATLDAEALTIGWAPIAASVSVMAGNEQLRRHDLAAARTLFERGLKRFGAARNPRLEAIARLGLLEASLAELEKPGAPVPQDVRDPRAKPTLHPELMRLLTAARGAAGSDAMLLGNVSLLEITMRADLGQFNRYRQAYADALAAAAEARKQFDAIGDVKRSAAAFAGEASIYLRRGDDRALDDALFAARQGDELLERSGLPPLDVLDELRAEVAFARRDFAEVHRRLDRLAGSHTAVDAPEITGRVVVPPGITTPITVVAWTGELTGDRTRVYTDSRTVEGDIVQAAPDGTFAIHAPRGAAIVAETKGLRSRPMLIGATPPVLELAPTTTLSGTVAGRNLFGVRAFARFTIAPDVTFVVQTPVEKDETFDLAGLPPGVFVTGTAGAAGHGRRVVLAGATPTKLVWPYGQGLDVIVRGKGVSGGRVWVYRGAVAVHDGGDLDKLAERAADSAEADLVEIGAGNTDAGREAYGEGDLHAVITGNPDGPVTVCAVTNRQDTGRAHVCETVTLKHELEIEYGDGRFASGMTPVVLRLP